MGFCIKMFFGAINDIQIQHVHKMGEYWFQFETKYTLYFSNFTEQAIILFVFKFYLLANFQPCIVDKITKVITNVMNLIDGESKFYFNWLLETFEWFLCNQKQTEILKAKHLLVLLFRDILTGGNCVFLSEILAIYLTVFHSRMLLQTQFLKWIISYIGSQNPRVPKSCPQFSNCAIWLMKSHFF